MPALAGSESQADAIERIISERLGVRLRGYQSRVLREVLEAVDGEGRAAVLVSMPTGSGKTLVEVAVGVWASRGGRRVLVLEPTRFLCDQMFRRFWGRVFEGSSAREYEGSCSGFRGGGARVVVSTPQTALKCVEPGDFDVLVVDEVHHMFGSRVYADLLGKLGPTVVFGFTALLPFRMRAAWRDFAASLGEPKFLDYDFRRLSELGGFEPPRAILDVYDSEFNQLEDEVYGRLWIGGGWGGGTVVAQLRTSLVKYGKRAFCESLSRLAAKLPTGAGELGELCSSEEPSHKARTVLEVLRVFDVEALRPVIVFTSRRATAYEIAEEISRTIAGARVITFTGDTERSERERLVDAVRRGEVDVVVSTRVGEEGVDIPEAGLLVMCDVPRSELRFYQRLGRLVRLSSPPKLKYLVLTLTPKTEEYHSLDEVLASLHAEGVDVSYIVVNVSEKGVERRVVEEVGRLAEARGGAAVPLTLVTWGRGDLDLRELLERVVGEHRAYREALAEAYRLVYRREPAGLGELYDALLTATLAPSIKIALSLDAKKDLKKLEERLAKICEGGRFARDLKRAIELGEVLYVYNVDKASSLMVGLYRKYYRRCAEEVTRCRVDDAIRLDSKYVTRLLMELFPASNLGRVAEWLAESVDLVERRLREVLKFDVWVAGVEENERTNSLMAYLYITLEEPGFTVGVRFSYYYMRAPYASNPQQIRTLVELNVKAIGLAVLEKFVEMEARED